MAGISFKIAKTGTKYCPSSIKKKPPLINRPPSSDSADKPSEAPLQSPGSKRKRPEVALSKINADNVALSLLSTTSEGSAITSEHEASFAVNLFLDGFSIGKPTEQGKQPPLAQEFTESLHPYNRTSETLFQAIDDGWLPGDILEEIPCKYVNGCVVCEVRDYRKGSPISGDSISSGEGFPVIQKVLLRPTMENIVKDISSMADESWAYSDLIEIESRILKALRPKLCLDPTPMLERLCESPNLNKLNLGVTITRRQKTGRGGFPSVKVTPNNLSHGKKVSIEGITEKAKYQTGIAGTTSAFEDSTISCSQESSAPISAGISSIIPTRSKIQCNIELGQDLYRHGLLGSPNSLPMQGGLNRSRLLHGQGNQSQLSSPVTSVSFASASSQDWTNTLTDGRNMCGSMFGKRDSRDIAMVNKPDLKKPKHEQSCMDTFLQQTVGPKFDMKPTRDQQRKDIPMQQNQNNETAYFSDMSVQRHPQQVTKIDDQQVRIGETSVDESRLPAHKAQRSTGMFKVKEEQLDFERGQIGIERESQEVERSKENQRLLELDNDQAGPQQMLSQRFTQEHYNKPSFQWQSLGHLGEKDPKRDDLFQKRKLLQNSREMQKQEGRSVLSSPPLPKSGELSQPLTSTAVSSISIGPSYSSMVAPVLAAVSTAATAVNSIQIDSQHQPTQQTMSIGRRRSNSLSKTQSASGVASPGSVTNTMTPSNVNSPSTGTAPILVNKPDQSVVTQNKQLETISTLLSVAQRHSLPMKKKRVEEVHEQKKVPLSCKLLLIALSSAGNNEDFKDVKGQRSLANSLIGGGINVRKTRIMNFTRADHILQGNSVPVVIRRNRVRLVMCERAKDGMVEAVVQYGDDQDEDSMNSYPHDVLPSLPNTHWADKLAEQFCNLMEKDGYELVDDQIQPIQNRQTLPSNAPPNATLPTHSMAHGTSALGSNMSQLPSSSHLMASQTMPGSAAVCGMPLNSLPLSSPNALSAVRMPPPGNAPNRQLSSGFLQSGLGASSKSLHLDPASQLAVVQQQQHQQHQQQPQQQQMPQHPQQQLQRSQQLVSTNHLTQLNAGSHNSNQQMNSQIINSANQSQIINSANQLQMQMLQHRQQQQQQLTRKMLIQGGMGGSLGAMGMGNINGGNSMNGIGMPVSGGLNITGLNGISNVVGMPGINNISASMGGMANLTNISPLSGIGMGQNPGIGNMMGQHIRGGSMSPQAVAMATKVRFGQARGRPGGIVSPPIRNTVENMSGISASNQAHSSASLAMLGQQQGRGNMNALQSRGMGPPKIGTTGMPGAVGQTFYLNQQLNNQSQQINSQQQLNQQQQLNLQQLNVPQPTSSQQPLSSQPLMNVQHQLNQQQQISPQQQLNSQSQINPQQQLNPQPLNSQPQLNPQQMNAGNLGSLVGVPGSPQLSSQTLGSVGSITSSPMELQSANRGNSMTTGQ